MDFPNIDLGILLVLQCRWFIVEIDQVFRVPRILRDLAVWWTPDTVNMAQDRVHRQHHTGPKKGPHNTHQRSNSPQKKCTPQKIHNTGQDRTQAPGHRTKDT